MKIFSVSRNVSKPTEGFEITVAPDHDKDLFGNYVGVSFQVARPLKDLHYFIALDSTLSFDEAESLGLHLLSVVKQFGGDRCKVESERMLREEGE